MGLARKSVVSLPEIPGTQTNWISRPELKSKKSKDLILMMSGNVLDLKILELRACKHKRKLVAMKNLSRVKEEIRLKDSTKVRQNIHLCNKKQREGDFWKNKYGDE